MKAGTCHAQPDSFARRLSLVRRVGRWMALMVVLAPMLGSAACATQVVSPRRDLAVGPQLSVESFLQAANQRDLEQMARLFGTPDGPIANTGSTFGCMFKRMGSWIALSDRCRTRQEIELRMNAIALMIQHDDYQMGGDQRVAGRPSMTTQIGVTLTRNGRSIGTVPFVVVETGDGWLIEEIGLEAVTGP